MIIENGKQATENLEIKEDPYELDFEELSSSLEYCFQEYPDWKEVISQIGIDHFIFSTKKYHSNRELLVERIKAFFHRTIQ